jgi:hypothetical protein
MVVKVWLNVTDPRDDVDAGAAAGHTGRTAAAGRAGTAAGPTRRWRWPRTAWEDRLPRLGITGHINLTPATADLVAGAIRKALAGYQPEALTGVSCIAGGADSIFAEAVLDAGGLLEVILPAEGYRDRALAPEDAGRFDDLLRRASVVRVMPFPAPGRDAYAAANEALLDSCDRLLAVWDGRPANGAGGTAEVVAHARMRDVPVEIIWPAGAQRTGQGPTAAPR